MNILSNLEPKNVMHYFEELSAIPRASKHEKQISDYLVEFAKGKGFEVVQDKHLNVIIKKPATPGYENVPTLILQGHMDMVCEKNQDIKHDFSVEGIKLQVVGDLIKGTGTTLGADNGIAVAFALALLDSNLPHPSLEVLITSDEEMGMTGALNLDGSLLKGKLMINLDTEEEGQIYVSCAGGARTDLEIPVAWNDSTKETKAIQFQIRGLQGGHSGADIHLQKGNSNKLLGRLLNELRKTEKFSLVEIFGGAKDNAIPREADATVCFENCDLNKIKAIVAKMDAMFKDEYRVTDADVRIDMKEITATKSMTAESTEKVVNALVLHPNGIKTWSMDIVGLVESSLNIGVIIQNESSVVFRSAVRGSVESRKLEIIEEIKSLSNIIGAKCDDNSHYPAWEYNPESKLRDAFCEVYEKEFGKKIELKAIHAGLECGVLSEKIPGVDIISFGPNIKGAHTPEENVSIKSINNVWDYFIKGVESLKNYY